MAEACKDCGSTTRKLVQVGTRTWLCATCKRTRRNDSRANARESNLFRLYKMTQEQYDALYAAQGGRCALCKWATGATKRLAVDHDHRCCPAPPTCGKCTRGLLCGECNQFISRRMHDDPAVALRFFHYLATKVRV